jgi:hypothetical protein
VVRLFDAWRALEKGDRAFQRYGVDLNGAYFPRARARGAALAARARGWCATAPRFKQLR